MRAGTHKLYITGFDQDGWTGTIKGKDGKPIYTIDTSNLSEECIVSNKILAIDDLDVIPQTFKTVRHNTNQRLETMTSFDLNFSVNVGDSKEIVARIRLNDEQAERLYHLLGDRNSN